MRILHLLVSNKLSGAENVAADICMMFNEDIEMIYCSPYGDIKQALEIRGVKYVPINRFSYKEIKRVIKEVEPDIIHAHDVKATVIASLISNKVPIISHLHGNSIEMRKISLKSILYAISTARVRKYIVVSESCLDDYKFKRVIIKKTKKLTNIIFNDRINKLIELSNEKYKFDFIYLGRLKEQKNHSLLINAFAKIADEFKEEKLIIYGEGSLRKELEELICKLNLRERVILKGATHNVEQKIKNAKLFILSSKYEGLPNVVMEAMALGLPIIATDCPCGGPRMLIEEYKNGILVEVDNVDHMASSIRSVLMDEEYQDKLGKNAKITSEKFQPEKIFSYWQKYIEDICN
jgi:glycosyltransferase involved in cell wall biosynthesis